MGSVTTDIQIPLRSGRILPEEGLKDLKSSVKGEILVKGETPNEAYTAAIDRFNKTWIIEAGIIVFCENEADIVACLKFVQHWSMDLAIACGRHSYYGASSTDGLVIDLRKMRKVSIDIEAQSISAQGGCKAVDLEAPLQEKGYSVVMGAANDTGIGGLTLGGGTGPLTGRYGMVIDNLIAARVVLADGSVLACSETANADLFWAIRGGGSNFGVVTEFTYKIHKQGPVYFGPVVFTPDKTHEFIQLIPKVDEIVKAADGKLAVFAAFGKAPGKPKVHPLGLIFYDGPEEEAKTLTAPLFDLGPAMQMCHVTDMAEITKPSAMTDGPPTHQHYSTSNAPLYAPLDLDVIETAVEDLDAFHTKFGAAVGPSKILIELRSYARSSSINPSATAFRARAPGFLMAVDCQHDGSNSTEVIRAEVKTIVDKVKVAVRAKHPEKGKFFNANIGDGLEKVTDMFGENLPRLREAKKKYDPHMVFNKWYPIPPAGVEFVGN